jgi:hypothetical protein
MYGLNEHIHSHDFAFVSWNLVFVIFNKIKAQILGGKKSLTCYLLLSPADCLTD